MGGLPAAAHVPLSCDEERAGGRGVPQLSPVGWNIQKAEISTPTTPPPCNAMITYTTMYEHLKFKYIHLCIHTNMHAHTNTQPGVPIHTHLHTHRETCTHKPATCQYAIWVTHSLALACSYVTTHIHTAMHVRIARPGSRPPSCREQPQPLASGREKQPSGAICQAEVPVPPILPELRQPACRACSLTVLSG